MHFNCAEVQLKIYWSIFDYAKVNYCKYTPGTLILHLKIIQSSSIVTLKCILGLILRNVHCAQVVLQISLERYVSKYVNRFELYLVWNKCILIYNFFTRVHDSCLISHVTFLPSWNTNEEIEDSVWLAWEAIFHY